MVKAANNQLTGKGLACASVLPQLTVLNASHNAAKKLPELPGCANLKVRAPAPGSWPPRGSRARAHRRSSSPTTKSGS